LAAAWGRPEDCDAAAFLFAYKPYLSPPSGNSSGPFVSAIRNSSEEEVRAAVAKAIELYERKDGSYKLRNSFQYLLGRV